MALAQALQRRADRRDDSRPEAVRDLVEHEQVRRADECLRERQHLLLAAAQRPGPLAQALAEHREVREHLLAELGAAAFALAHGEVLLDRQVAEERLLLGGVGNPHPRDPVGRPAGDVAIAERHGPTGRLEVAHHRLQQRGLAHPVPADDRERAVLGHGEADLLENHRRAVAGPQPCNLDLHDATTVPT